MVENKDSFEENMEKLEQIVDDLQSGNVPLEKALAEFKMGVTLSQEMQKTLENAKNTLTKMVNDEGEEVPFTRDKGYQAASQSNSEGNEDLPF